MICALSFIPCVEVALWFLRCAALSHPHLDERSARLSADFRRNDVFSHGTLRRWFARCDIDVYCAQRCTRTFDATVYVARMLCVRATFKVNPTIGGKLT